MPDVFTSEKNKKTVKTKKSKNLSSKKTRKNTLSTKILKKSYPSDHHPLSSFRLNPDRADFFNKDPEEKVILLLRRHPITNVRWIMISVFMLLAPSFLTVMPFFEFLPFEFQMIAVFIWYLITTAYIFEKFLSWYFNVNIITDERIFDVDFVNLVYREITDANIDEIQDVTVEIGSATRTTFNYGNVVVQTAAEIPQIEFEGVPQPDKVARILRELRIEEEIEKLEGRVR